ncbi:RHS repeat-associated core domain-containing protein, partial [Corallococcus caeni]|uniref:RHS repeat-associated core domain-containing protein n=1 Tax=Corallococcus caeni TaxID=3082388 RepID=UPI0030C699AD
FQYVSLPLPYPYGGTHCVLRSVTRRGESSPAVTYAYQQEGSTEITGQIVSATTPSTVRTYTFTNSALQVSTGSMLVMTHTYSLDWQGRSTGKVTAVTGAGEQLALGTSQSTTCQPGSNCCGVAPSKRDITNSNAGRGDGTSGSAGFTQSFETLTNASQGTGPRLYRTVDSCTVAGACSPGNERNEWECATSTSPGFLKAKKDKRDFWEVYSYAAPAVGTGMPASLLEKTSIKRGAQDMTGTGALEENTFSYTYGPSGEQLLAASEKVSVLGAAGQKARTFNRYDTTGRPSATLRSGWTRVFDAATGTWSSQQRWVGTFYLTTRTGESTPDALGRTLEVHGPCFVSTEAATDCATGTVFPVTRNYYWGDTETTPRRNQLQKVAQYPAGLTSTPIETLYNAYDAGGHVTEQVDANGITTSFVYHDNNLASQTVHVTGQPDVATQAAYDSAGHRTSLQLPEGNYEVFCYRQGTTSGCTGGTLTDKLQWKAKSSTATATTWSEKVTYTYWPDGSVSEERYLDAAGSTRKLLSYAADAHRRPTWTKTGTGTGSFVATKSYDAANNLTGEGKPFNAPPAWCAAGTDGQPTSAACNAMQYDGANRLLRVDEHPTGSTTTRTCLKHDAHGNVISVDTGLTATTNCATATPSANASRYQYDDFGNLVEATLAATGEGSTAGTTRFAYDAQGSTLVKQTPAMAAAHVRDHLAYGYDAMGRLLSASHVSPLISGGAETLYAQGYDASASPDASCGTLTNTLGRLRYQDDSFGRTWFSYDAWGRMVKQVRLRIGTTTCTGTPFQNPHTLYAYSPNGNLTQVTYPYGRVVTYTYGTGALTDRVASVSVSKYASGAPTTETLLSQVAWEPYGGVRGYRTHYATTGTTGSVEYALGDNASAAPTSCPSAFPSVSSSDTTGRLRALWVSTLASGTNFTPGSGNGAILKQVYTWQADQLVRSDSCLLGATSPLTETYGYDGLLRLTSATGTLSTTGGAFTSRGFGYDARGNRTSESGEANTWALAYSTSGHPDQLVSRNSTQTGATLGHSFTYDADGRVSQKLWRPADAFGNAFHLDFTSGPSSNGGADTVFKAVSVNGLSFNYFYDAQGQRRLKDYPTGIKDEYFYNASQGLLVDQGNASAFTATIHPVDEYVWLGGRPVAILRGKLDASWAHLSDATADCARDGQTAACGTYHLVTDSLGKPVLMLDGQGRVTGTGEYDAFGHVNRVSVDIETPHPYKVTTTTFGGVMKQPAVSGTTLQQRVLFDGLDLWNESEQCAVGSADRSDSVAIRDEASSADLTTRGAWEDGRGWTAWVTPGTAGVRAAIINSGIASCSQGQSCNDLFCHAVCNCTTTGFPQGSKQEKGAVISAYEYRRFQTGAAPFWTPLRFPGQYHDAETDLFENWNRFYDPSIGRYLQSEVLAPKSPLMAKQSPYGYAEQNPGNKTDTTGQYTVSDPYECPNWRAAEWLARKWAGCNGSTGDQDCACQQALQKCSGGCDICQHLEMNKGPEADFPDLGPLTPNPKNGDPTELDGQRAYEDVGFWSGKPKYRFNKQLCEDSAYIPALASTLIHEATHACAFSNPSRKGLLDRNTFPGMLQPPPEGCAAFEVEAKCNPLPGSKW